MGCHLLSSAIEKKYWTDIEILECNPIYEDFHDCPAIDNYGYMLECLACYDSFNKKSGGYWNANDDEDRIEGEMATLESISKMLLMFWGNCPMICSVLPNGEVTIKGNGWKRPKFHSHLHLAKWISDLGSPANYNTQRFESNHKEMIKNV